jgi:dephospho-CoA kinase
VLLVGLTGGIGSGKSTVSALLGERGAVVIDADLIAREVVTPGGMAYAAVVDRFGRAVLDTDGRIDRAALADVVFRDAAARKDLEAITHPAVGQVMAERIAAVSESDRVVLLDIPLLAEKGRMGVAAVIVVDCPEEVAIERLVQHRGFDEADARRRIAAQLSREKRRELADLVIDNGGTLDQLVEQVDRAWAWLDGRPAADSVAAVGLDGEQREGGAESAE